MQTITVSRTMVVLSLCLSLGVPPGLLGQNTVQGAQQESKPQESQKQDQKASQEGIPKDVQQEEKPPLRPEELDQLTASIALYPDDLVAQVLSASTYPVEVVQAARFAKEKKDLKGEKLMAAAKDKDWDPSVKAMLEFPDVLKMMDEKLDWTTKVGDAFLSQQRDVMDSIQRLRRKANEAGNLKTTQEQKVVVEQQTQTIVIQPANPQVVYVPTYNPTVVYGTWPYPAYPPYPVYPPGYVATGVLSFRRRGGRGCGVGWLGRLALQLARRGRRYQRESLQQLHEEQLHQCQPISGEPEPHQPSLATQSAASPGRPVHQSGDGPEIWPKPGRDSTGHRCRTGGTTRRCRRPNRRRRRGRDPGPLRAGGAGAATRTAPSSRRASAFSGGSSGGSARAASVRGQASRSSPSASGGGGARTGGGGASRRWRRPPIGSESGTDRKDGPPSSGNKDGTETRDNRGGKKPCFGCVIVGKEPCTNGRTSGAILAILAIIGSADLDGFGPGDGTEDIRVAAGGHADPGGSVAGRGQGEPADHPGSGE